MTRLEWNAPGTRTYEAGVDRGVLYTSSGEGVSWSGLISVQENPSGGDLEPYYFDGIKYLNVAVGEDFSATIEAFTYPEEFAACDGTLELEEGLVATQQPRQPFGLCYRTKIGNDLNGDAGYRLHLVYNAMASPTARANTTLTDSPSPMNFQWAIETVPEPAAGNYKPTAHLVVDSTKVDPAVMSMLEDRLYGEKIYNAYLPSQQAVISLIATGDGPNDGGISDGGTPDAPGVDVLDGGTPWSN